MWQTLRQKSYKLSRNPPVPVGSILIFGLQMRAGRPHEVSTSYGQCGFTLRFSGQAVWGVMHT